VVTKHTSSRYPTCPFCALHCDDLSLRGRDNPGEGVCRVAERGYRAALRAGTPLVDGEAVDADAALDAARRLLRRAKRPLVSGLGTDVAGMRAALELARARRAYLDPAASPAQLTGLSVMQRQGTMTTTYSEVRNRADLVIVFGPDLFDAYPRFAERCLPAARSIDGTDLSGRTVVVVGAQRAPAALAGLDVVPLKCSPEDVPGLVQALAARRRGFAPRLSRALDRHVETLAELLAGARYTALVWQHDRWLGETPVPVVEALHDLILAINTTDRAAALVLGGDHGAATAAAVAAWRTGYPLGLKFERASVTYDPIAHAWDHLLRRGETDLVVWVDAFGALPPPDTGDVPLLLIGGTAEAAGHARVALPAGVPGVTHDAQLARGDQVVSLTLRAPKSYADGSRTDAAGWLAALCAGDA